ncbi:hypothetical protein D3C78_1300850 [compost metagenome]
MPVMGVNTLVGHAALQLLWGEAEDALQRRVPVQHAALGVLHEQPLKHVVGDALEHPPFALQGTAVAALALHEDHQRGQ